MMYCRCRDRGREGRRQGGGRSDLRLVLVETIDRNAEEGGMMVASVHVLLHWGGREGGRKGGREGRRW